MVKVFMEDMDRKFNLVFDAFDELKRSSATKEELKEVKDKLEVIEKTVITKSTDIVEMRSTMATKYDIKRLEEGIVAHRENTEVYTPRIIKSQQKSEKI